MGVDHHELPLVEKDVVSRAEPVDLPSDPAVHGPRLRIATGSDAKASEPSAQRMWRCASLRDLQTL